MGIDLNLVRNIEYTEQFTKQDHNNLNTLWNRKSGEHLYASSDGKLKKVGLWQQIRCAFSSSYKAQTPSSV